MDYHFKKRVFWNAFLLFCITSISSCFISNNLPITQTLSNNELVGEWKPTLDSVDFLRKENICCENKEINLTLFENKTFILTNIPDCWINDFGDCKGTNYTFKGDWAIYQERENSPQNLHLLVKNSVKEKVYSISLIQKNNKILINFVFGDPDSGRGIFLAKD